MKPLSKSAKTRLLRQSLKQIRALEQRLVTCPMESFNTVKDVLIKEREAYRILESK